MKHFAKNFVKIITSGRVPRITQYDSQKGRGRKRKDRDKQKQHLEAAKLEKTRCEQVDWTELDWTGLEQGRGGEGGGKAALS